MSLYHLHHKSQYPKMKFAPAGGAVIVANETEEKALGHGWTDAAPAIEEPSAEEPAKPAKRGRK